MAVANFLISCKRKEDIFNQTIITIIIEKKYKIQKMLHCWVSQLSYHQVK